MFWKLFYLIPYPLLKVDWVRDGQQYRHKICFLWIITFVRSRRYSNI